MKYRILIADDEERIIRLIRKLGHWDELDIEVVGTSRHGQEAVSMMEELHPDIVITDIKMPVVDGLQMIELAKQRNLEAHFIVISGYKQFEYARNALSLGVVDYLLKPINEQQLNITLEKTCRMIDAKRRQVSDGVQLEKFQKLEHIHYREKLYCNLQDKDFCWENAVNCEEVCNERYNTKFFTDGRYCCAYITTNIVDMLTFSESLFLEKTENSIEESIRNKGQWLCHKYEYGLLLIVEYTPEKAKDVKRALSELFYKIKNLTEIYGEFILNIGLSTEKGCICELRTAASEAVTAEWGRLASFGDRILTYDENRKLGRFAILDIMDQDMENALRECIRSLNTVELGKIFKNINERTTKYAHGYPGDMRAFVNYVVNVVETYIPSEFKEKIDRQMNVICTKAKGFPQILHGFYLYLSAWMEEKMKMVNNKNIQPILQAKGYIDTHYGEQISLEKLAEQYSFSANYFGRIFQEEVGVGFSDYLMNVRIEQAKELLIQTNASAKEISEQVGYLDSKYFYKVFKKKVGIKPTDFRKLYS